MFEFGTVNSDNLQGAFHTLKTMIIENQAYHNGFKSISDKTHVEGKFLEMFYPKDPVWRDEVIRQFQEALFLIFKELINEVKN